MDPERIELEAAGMRFGALAWGNRTAPLALLVHGYPDSAWSWRKLGPRLAEDGWRAVAPFTRGYAPTDLAPEKSYLIRDLAGDILGLHSALGGDERAVLVGHDWGAAATYAVTELEPDRFRSYVVVSVPPSRTFVEPPRSLRALAVSFRQARSSWYFLFNQLPGAERRIERTIPKHWRNWAPGYAAAEEIQRALEALPDPERRRAALGYYRQNLRGDGLAAAIRLRPRVPVLYIHGRDDGCIQAGLATRAGSILPSGSRVELVDGAGHFPQLEQPELVASLVAGWIGRAGP